MSADLLPMDLVKHILTYDPRYVLRGQHLLLISPINKECTKYKYLAENIHSPIYKKIRIDVTYIQFPIKNTNKSYFLVYSTYEKQVHLIEVCAKITYQRNVYRLPL
jgi:hypothetical protein